MVEKCGHPVLIPVELASIPDAASSVEMPGWHSPQLSRRLFR